MWVVCFAEFRGVTVGDDSELAKVAILQILGHAFHTKHLALALG